MSMDKFVSEYISADHTFGVLWHKCLIIDVVFQVREMLSQLPKDCLGNPLLQKRLAEKQWVCKS